MHAMHAAMLPHGHHRRRVVAQQQKNTSEPYWTATSQEDSEKSKDFGNQ